MKKRPPAGKCVHCLKEFNDLTWDHLLPESWYPKDDLSKTGKLKFPSCQKCNNDLGNVEERLRMSMALCFNPEDEKNFPWIAKVMRSIRPNSTDSLKERKIRLLKRRKLLFNDIFPITESNQKGVVPNFGLRQEHLISKMPPYGIRVSADDIHKFGEKLIKGLIWCKFKQFTAHGYVASSYLLEDSAAIPIIDLINQTGKIVKCGMHFESGVSQCCEDGNSFLLYFNIWNRFKIYGAVIPMQEGANT